MKHLLAVSILALAVAVAAHAWLSRAPRFQTTTSAPLLTIRLDTRTGQSWFLKPGTGEAHWQAITE